jgi:NAD+ kinase
MSKKRQFSRVGVVAKATSSEAVETAVELAEWVARRGLTVDVDKATRKSRRIRQGKPFDPEAGYDLVVVLGGDGTLLSVARTLTDGVPILGVNLGSLGFLTEINRSELYPSLVRVLAGNYSLEERALVDVELTRASGEKISYRILNDAVIAKAARARIITLKLEVDGSLVARFRSDGLIISTPTGSTAYNLSAAGPILNPLLPVAVLTPICAHTLSLRPVVAPDSSCVEVTLETDGEEVYLTLDGQEGTDFGYQDKVCVTRSEAHIQLIKISGRTFYDSLRDKLRWGGLSTERGERLEPEGE